MGNSLWGISASWSHRSLKYFSCIWKQWDVWLRSSIRSCGLIPPVQIEPHQVMMVGRGWLMEMWQLCCSTLWGCLQNVHSKRSQLLGIWTKVWRTGPWHLKEVSSLCLSYFISSFLAQCPRVALSLCRRWMWMWYGPVPSVRSWGPSDQWPEPPVGQRGSLVSLRAERLQPIYGVKLMIVPSKTPYLKVNAWWEVDKERVCEIIAAPWGNPGGGSVFFCALQRFDRRGNVWHL